MSKMSKNKGASGERELLALLSDELGINPPLKRNLTQTRLDGGADCIELKGWSIEVKRQEKPHIQAWWEQTCYQCNGIDKPLLFYRSNYQPWRAMMLLSTISNGYLGSAHTVTMSFEAACMIIREGV